MDTHPWMLLRIVVTLKVCGQKPTRQKPTGQNPTSFRSAMTTPDKSPPKIDESGQNPTATRAFPSLSYMESAHPNIEFLVLKYPN